ncbi:MAG: efflux RND transporter permease subunit [Ketobacteraceae bacterium]|nr:efflux RND transporter permease subunit [Ketobacteraceae bacterium]
MSAWKNRVESGFESLAGVIYRHPVAVLLAVLVVVCGLATQLNKVYFDTSTEGFLSPDHPSILEYNAFRDVFGRDELLVVGVEIPAFSQAFFRRFELLYRQLDQELPHTDSVDSILTARHVYGVEDELVVEDLFEQWPETDKELAALKHLMETHPLYKGFFVSPDLSLATIVIRLRYLQTGDHSTRDEHRSAADKQITEVLDEVYRIIDQHRAEGLEIHLAGSPTIVDLLKRSMLSDMQLFVKLVIAIIALMLFLLFRRVSAVFYPLMTVILAVVTTISLMSAFGQPIQLPTAIVPSFLLAVGVGDSIHFLTLFYRHFDAHGNKEAAISYGLGHAGLAMFLTSVTTAIGLGSFSTAKILPVANMGIFTAVGVMLAFVFTVLVLPALVTLTPMKPHGDTVRKTPAKKTPFIDWLIDKAIALSTGYPKTVVLVCTCLLGLSLFSASRLVFSHNPLVWLPDDLALKQSIQTIDKKLGGSISVEVLVDTGAENGVYDPALLNAIDGLCERLSHYENEYFAVAKVLCVTDLVKETNRALHGNDQTYYRVPDERALVAQELFLLELSGAEDLYRLVDRQYQMTRVTLTIPWIDSLLYEPFMAYLEQEFKQTLGDRAEVTITGLVPLLGSTLRSVIHSAAKSYVIAFVIITLTMMLLLESVRYGILSMFPNLLPIIIVMGIMQVAGVPLDMFTMLIGSIAIGLCVDDTVHFMHHFRRYLSRGCTVEESIANTLHTAGRAMLVTSLVLCSGFIVMVFSAMNNLTNFGIYTGLSVALALLADFLLAPALMVLFAHRENSAGTGNSAAGSD